MSERVNNNMLNMRQAQDVAGVSRRTLYNWIKAGKLPVYRTAGGGPRFRREDLEPKLERRNDPLPEPFTPRTAR